MSLRLHTLQQLVPQDILQRHMSRALVLCAAARPSLCCISVALFTPVSRCRQDRRRPELHYLQVRFILAWRISAIEFVGQAAPASAAAVRGWTGSTQGKGARCLGGCRLTGQQALLNELSSASTVTSRAWLFSSKLVRALESRAVSLAACMALRGAPDQEGGVYQLRRVFACAAD